MNLAGPFAAKGRWDVAVAGAGPAGAFAAYRLAASGLRVLLIEKQSFPRYKVCGGCFSSRAVAALRAAGLAHLFDQIGAQTLHGFALACKGQVAHLALPGGRAASRASFDTALVEAAVSAGVSFLPECRAVLADAGGEYRKVVLHHARGKDEIHAKVVLGADGLAGTVRKNFHELASRSSPGSYIGAGSMAAVQSSFYQPGTIYMAHSRFGYVGLVRVENGRLAIAAALASDFVKRAESLARAVAEVLCRAGFPPIPDWQSLPWQGTPALTRRTARMSDHRFFALGDAAGYVEPFTGEGITWALSSAEALVPLVQRGVAQWSPQLEHEWANVHHRAVGHRQVLCRMIARALRHPLLIATIVRLAKNNWLSLAPLADYLHLDAGTQEQQPAPAR
jgi:flavin-dependent dehydrogenase